MRTVSAVIAMCLTGCGLMGLFEEPVTQCGTPGERRSRANACGVCGTGLLTEECQAHGGWSRVDCVDPLDGDGDGFQNPACLEVPEGCCAERVDCNDGDPTIHPIDYECLPARDTGARPCDTACGTSGTRTCSAACTWSACAAPVEACNGEDEDCDTTPDNGFACAAGASESCAVEGCGTAGVRACLEDCSGWGGCVAEEACNGCDDDDDGSTDELFACVRGAVGVCTVEGCPGTRRCSTECAWDACAPDFPVPTAPRPLAPLPGRATGSFRLPPWRFALRPEFSWSAAVGCPASAIRYQVQVDDDCPPDAWSDCTFPHPEVDHGDLTTTRFRSTADLAVSTTPPVGRRYYWRVRACYVDGACGDWSRVSYLDAGRAPGDVNGDGYSDFLVGAPDTSTIAPSGLAYLYLGGPDPADLTPLAYRSATSRHLGRAVALPGDVNGDGFADLVLGAEGSDGAQLFLGGETPDATRDGQLSGLGWFLGAVGDLDADGFADLAAFSENSGEVRRGAAAGFASAGGELVLAGAGPYATAPGGDLDGDGFPDFVLGEPQSARVGLFYGATDLPDRLAPLHALVGSAVDGFGAAVAGLGDLDGDGWGEVLVGSPQNVGSGPLGPGALELFLGGDPPDADADNRWLSETDGDLFGLAVAAVGDLDGDGRTDFAAGARHRNAASTGGAVLVVWDRTDSTAQTWVSGRAPGQGFGSAVAPAGDVNADGYDDLVVGAPFDDGFGLDAGRAYLYTGRPERTLTDTDRVALSGGPEANQRFGSAVAGATAP